MPDPPFAPELLFTAPPPPPPVLAAPAVGLGKTN